MAEEEATQRHTEASAKTPAAHHRASSQDDTPLPKKQASFLSWLPTVERYLPTVERIIDIALDLVIRGTCVWGAIFGYQHTQNPLFFLLCLALARKELGVLDAIRLFLSSVGLLKQGNHSSAHQIEEADPHDLVNGEKMNLGKNSNVLDKESLS